MSNEPKLSERLRALASTVHTVELIEPLREMAAQAEALEAREPVPANERITNAAMNRMSVVMAQRTEILEAFIAKYGWDPERTQQVIQNMEDGSQRYYVAIKPETREPDDSAHIHTVYEARGGGYICSGCDMRFVEAREPKGYTATECSEIARKRYADEPRRTSQQQQYAQGLEDGYGHALFEHLGK